MSRQQWQQRRQSQRPAGEFDVLYVLKIWGPSTVTKISKYAHRTAARVETIIDQLESHGDIEQTEHNSAGDSRYGISETASKELTEGQSK